MGLPNRRTVRGVSAFRPAVILAFALGLALGLGLAQAAVAPLPAAAHAELVLGDPAAGTGLPQAPSRVVLKFDEPLDLRLSRITVLDSGGHDVATGPTEAVAGDPQAMERRLGLLSTGIYEVAWTSVSVVDGHTLHGTYLFGVGTAVSGHAASDEGAIDSNGPLDLVGRFAALLGLTLWAGAVILRRTAARAALRADRLERLVAAGPPLAIVGTLLSATSAALVTAGSLTALPTILTTTSGLWQATVIAAGVVGVLALAGRPGSLRRPAFSLAGAVAVVAEAASGHPAATPQPLLFVPVAAAHLAAAGVWIFAIAASALAATDLRRALAAFTPYAVGAAVVVGLTGIANAAGQVPDLNALTGTGYGAFVIAKAILLLLVAGLGSGHFLVRRRAGPAAADLAGRLELPARLELGAILVTLAVAATMTGFATPPREAAEDVVPPTTDPVLTGLGERAALSVAGASGPFVVGLTILPPQPGRLELRVQVLGVEAGDGLRQARVVIAPGFDVPGSRGAGPPFGLEGPTNSSPGASSSPTPGASPSPGAARPPIIAPLDLVCGLGCFAGQASLPAAGDWTFLVAIDTNRGPIAVSQRLHLPAPDARSAFRAALAKLDALRSASLHETLAAAVGSTPVVADYRFTAPDAMSITVGSSERRLIGTAAYDRQPDGSWQATAFPPPGFSWPSGYYASFWGQPVAIRQLPDETVDGVRYTVLAFLRPDIPAWFRIWIDPLDGLVHRDEMLAQGHIMEHTASAFETTAPVVAPPGVSPPTPLP